jgi:magnesium transporter
MADAVGTQTETLVIRGFSVGVPARRMLRLEILTGAVVGVLLSLAMFPLAVAVTGDTRLSIAVALALLASASCATMVAMSLPWLMIRLNFDPAFGSGPLATVIQDLLSIVVYFAIAAAMIG